jgi:hypothetical protein
MNPWKFVTTVVTLCDYYAEHIHCPENILDAQPFGLPQGFRNSLRHHTVEPAISDSRTLHTYVTELPPIYLPYYMDRTENNSSNSYLPRKRVYRAIATNDRGIHSNFQ